MRSTRISRFVAAVLAVTLTGCIASREGEPSEPVVSEEPAPSEEPDPSEPEPTSTDDATDEPEPSPTASEEAAPPLEGTPGTDPARAEPDGGGLLAVVDVRVAAHDGFDRVVFDIGGDDGTVGWDVRYVDVPTSQGSGEEAEVDGEAYLAVSISGVALPPDLPPDVEVFTDDVDGPADGTVVEVVHDSIFEGYHLFFVGLDAEAPYVVERLDDPQRLVIDLHHD
ncbi:MAG TPA: hypothetical protein VK906_13485 [Egicoccus sp.]|nr:hypothetical protein [Egicoccus sp.]HSK24192.1 hypothetical protein [Egicoccus sp.]